MGIGEDGVKEVDDVIVIVLEAAKGELGYGWLGVEEVSESWFARHRCCKMFERKRTVKEDPERIVMPRYLKGEVCEMC